MVTNARGAYFVQVDAIVSNMYSIVISFYAQIATVRS